MFNSKRFFFSVAFLLSLILAIGIFGGCGNQNPVGSKDSTLAPNVSGENGDNEPSYVSSIRVPDNGNDSEADEFAQLSKLANLIASNKATEAAKAKFPAGKVINTKLENENGNVVYAVEIDTGSGIKDVKVDAGNGTILNIEADEAEGVEENGKDNEKDEPGGLESNHEFEGEEEGEH
jgi:uncharacterized membrane protein YkoI